MFSFDHRSNSSEPESDPAFTQSHYEWIYRIPDLKRGDAVALLLKKEQMPSPELQELLTQIAAHDLVVVSGPETVLISAIPTQCIWRPTGSDLTVMPALSFGEKVRIGRTHVSIGGLLRHLWERIVYRRAIASATLICTSASLPPYGAALKRLGVGPERLRDSLPLVVDADAFQPTPADEEQGTVLWPDLERPFVVFWPGRMMFTKPSARGVDFHTGQWKKSEAGLDGFALFLARLAIKERGGVRLVIPDRTQSDDLELARTRVVELGLQENVVFVAGESRQGLTRQEMLMIFANSSASFDDFGSGWYGSAVVESLAAGVPVITFAPDEHYPDRTPTPFLNASEPQGIADHLYRLWSNRAEFDRIRDIGLRWLEQHHSSDAYLRRLHACYVDLVR